MEFNFAHQQAKRNGRTKIIWGVLLIAAVILLKLLVFEGSILNIFGPYESFSSGEELNDLYSSQKRYVTAEAEEFWDSGYVMTEDGKDKYYFFLYPAEDMYVICRTSLKYTEYEYTDFTVKGKLHKPDSDYSKVVNKITAEIADSWEVSTSEASDFVSPYILYQDASRIPDQLIILGGLAVVVIAILLIIGGLRGMVDYTSTKSYKKLGQNGAVDPAYMNEGISREMAEGRVQFESKTLVVTQNWVGEKGSTNFRICPKQDVVWIYRTVTQHRTNGIPTGKSHTISLCTVNKTIMNVAAKNEKDAGKMLDALSQCGFTAVFGHTPEVAQMYAGNMEQFILLARQQAAQMAQPQPQQGAYAQQPAYGQPQQAYGQVAEGQPQQPAYGQPGYEQPQPQVYGQPAEPQPYAAPQQPGPVQTPPAGYVAPAEYAAPAQPGPVDENSPQQQPNDGLPPQQ